MFVLFCILIVKHSYLVQRTLSVQLCVLSAIQRAMKSPSLRYGRRKLIGPRLHFDASKAEISVSKTSTYKSFSKLNLKKVYEIPVLINM